MIDRKQGIIIELFNAEGPITSGQLAEILGVSIRTIKNEMPGVAEILSQNGAVLVSKRNWGYSYHIVDKERFDGFSTGLYLKSNRSIGMSRESQILYIARRLIAAKGGIHIEELSEELYLSKTALKKPLADACRFCESFRMKIISGSQGICVEGMEYMRRIAMMELMGQHFHKIYLDNADEQFQYWVRCDYQERQDIRHCFLKTLRESGFTMRDSVTQRIAVYLLIARNRIRDGLVLVGYAGKYPEIIHSSIYHTAENMIKDLDKSFEGYGWTEDEITGLAVFILCNLSVGEKFDIASVAPWLQNEIYETTEYVLDAVKERCHMDFRIFEDGALFLSQLMLPMLAEKKYELDGREGFDYSYELNFLRRPLCVYYANMIAEALQEKAGLKMNLINLNILSCYVLSMLDEIAYDVKPLRVLSTHSLGGKFAERQVRHLRERYGELIATVTPMELYEIRGVKAEDHDVVLVGHGGEGQESIGYYYDYPMTQILMTRQGRDFNAIYNDILIKAYQVDSLLPAEEEIQVIQHFAYFSPELFFQFISQRHAKDETCRIKLEGFLNKWIRGFSYQPHSHIAIVAGIPYLCKGNGMELYCMDKPAEWLGKRVSCILYLCLDGAELWEMKALETCISLLVRNLERVERFKKNPHGTLLELLHYSFRNI